jgi:energy-converting hydrogenase B subunit D
MMDLIVVFFGIVMIAAALFAIHSKSMLSAVIGSGVVSLVASILYIILHAPDVAMTEAAIGSGLTTVVFLFALKRIHSAKKEKHHG